MQCSVTSATLPFYVHEMKNSANWHVRQSWDICGKMTDLIYMYMFSLYPFKLNFNIDFLTVNP